MSSPMQQFIENYMRVSQMNTQQAQFAEQQELQKRQMETQEIGQFMNLAQNVQKPEELGALAEFFSMRNPAMAGTYQELMLNIAPTLVVQQAGAAHRGRDQMEGEAGDRFDRNVALTNLTGMTEGDAVWDMARSQVPMPEVMQGVRIGMGTELSAGQTEQSRLTEAGMAQDASQFAMNYGQRQNEFAQQMGFSYSQLGQQGAQFQTGLMAEQGMFPQMMIGQYQDRIAEIDQELGSTSMLRPEVRERLQRERSQMLTSIGQLQSQAAAVGRGAQPSLNQLLDARATAVDDINSSTDMGTKQAATDAYLFVNSMLRAYGFPQTQLETVNPLFGAPRTQIVP